jgi:membrane-bound ClpP family serine protease
MKKCIRCGRMVPDETRVCDNCAFDFIEYEQHKHLFDTKEDPVVPEEQKTSLVDNPIICFILGIISFLLMALFLFTADIIIIYLIGVVLFVFLTYYFSVKPAKVKLKPFQVVGIWLANIAISVTIFKIVYVLIDGLLQ